MEQFYVLIFSRGLLTLKSAGVLEVLNRIVYRVEYIHLVIIRMITSGRIVHELAATSNLDNVGHIAYQSSVLSGTRA